MTDQKKPEMLADADLDSTTGAGSVKLLESHINGEIIPAAPTSASRKVPLDSFSINFAKIEVGP